MYKSCFPLSGMLCSPNEKKQERRKKEERSSLPRFKSLIKPRDIFMVVWFIVRADIRNKSKGQFWLVLCHVLLVQTVNRIPCVKPGNLPRLAKKKKKRNHRPSEKSCTVRVRQDCLLVCCNIEHDRRTIYSYEFIEW